MEAGNVGDLHSLGCDQLREGGQGEDPEEIKTSYGLRCSSNIDTTNSDVLEMDASQLRYELVRERTRTAVLKEKIEVLWRNTGTLSVRLEEEEEFMANRFLKQFSDFKKQKELLLIQVEQEEELLTNTLQKKLQTVLEDKVNMERRLEAEQEFLVNTMSRQLVEASVPLQLNTQMSWNPLQTLQSSPNVAAVPLDSSIVSSSATQPQQLPRCDKQEVSELPNLLTTDVVYLQGSLDALSAIQSFINVWLDKRRHSSLGCSNILSLQVPSPPCTMQTKTQLCGSSVQDVVSPSLRQIWSECPTARRNSLSTTASTTATNKCFAPTTTGKLKSQTKPTTINNPNTAATNNALFPSSASSVSSEPLVHSSIAAYSSTAPDSQNSVPAVRTKSPAPLRVVSPHQATTAGTNTMTTIGTSTSVTTPTFSTHRRQQSTSNSNSMCGHMRIRSASGRGFSCSRRRGGGANLPTSDMSASNIPFLPLQNWSLQQHPTSSIRYLSGETSLPLSPSPSSISRSSTLYSNHSTMQLRRSSEGDVRRLSGFPVLSATCSHNYHLPPTSLLGLSLLPPVLETHGTDAMYHAYGSDTEAIAAGSNADTGIHSYDNSGMDEFLSDMFAFMQCKSHSLLHLVQPDDAQDSKTLSNPLPHLPSESPLSTTTPPETAPYN